MRVQVNRKAHFNAAHRLFNPNWTDEKNEEIFGLCNNPNFHGHNYNLTVSVTGDVDPETGYVMDMKILKDIIKKQVTSKLDHKNLNIDVPQFKNLIPTAEHIAFVCYTLIKEVLPENLELRITLFETERNWVTYPVS
ncbi:MAG: 6-pyruvoyltetrahydropterin/6-carboxytetrahydropterin synthase [Salibacteraceae bacterium]|jgi:6-pyruvoyltetrahydropterin/6-carboxytetrahydropterin synthase